MREGILFSFLMCVISFQSCVSLSGFEEGRSLEEGQSSVQLNFNTMQVNDLSSSDDIYDLEYFPNLEVVYKFGITDKLSGGVKLNTFGNAGFNAKYQVMGDKHSSFAMALGTEVNSFAWIGLFNVHLPLYMSYYPSSAWTINFAPRYVVQFGTAFSDETIRAVQYAGGNAGIMYGKKHKIGLDVGYHQFFGPDAESIGMVNIGIGGKFVFGGTTINPEETNKVRSRRRKS
jgi:hypothetical protein